MRVKLCRDKEHGPFFETNWDTIPKEGDRLSVSVWDGNSIPRHRREVCRIQRVLGS